LKTTSTAAQSDPSVDKGRGVITTGKRPGNLLRKERVPTNQVIGKAWRCGLIREHTGRVTGTADTYSKEVQRAPRAPEGQHMKNKNRK